MKDHRFQDVIDASFTYPDNCNPHCICRFGLAQPSPRHPSRFSWGLMIAVIVSFGVIMTVRANRSLAFRANIKPDSFDLSADTKPGTASTRLDDKGQTGNRTRAHKS